MFKFQEKACNVSISLSRAAGVHLVVDATVAHLDLEETHVTPGVVPGVHAEPVVLAVLSAPTDSLDSVTAKSRASSVLVNAGLVGQEVFVDSEGRSDSTVLLDVSLDSIDATDAVAAVSKVLIGLVSAIFVINTGVVASGLNLFDVIAKWQGFASDVMSALLHRVVVASAGGAVVASSNDTGLLEPGPWGANLATVAAEGEAAVTIAAASCVGNGEERSEVALAGNANTIVQSLGGTVSPA